MPARFLEVANPLEAARKSGSLSYVTSQISQLSWERFNFSSLVLANNGTNFTLFEAADVLRRVPQPSGLAKACLIVGVTVYVLQLALIHWVAKRHVAAHGHAHRE